jgi:glycosyltransferase involved in cell wall biosynthesis
MTDPLRVLFLVPDLDVGGAERHLVNLVAAMDRERFAPSVVCLGDEGPLFGELAAAGVPGRALHRHKKGAVLAAVDLWRLMRRERPALVVGRGYNAETLGRLVAVLLGVPAAVWMHETRSMKRRTAARRLLDRALNPRSAGVLAMDDAQRPHLARLRWRPDQIRLAPPGISAPVVTTGRAQVRAALGVPDAAELIAIVARLRPEKDHATMLRAFALVRRARPGARLLVVGDGTCGDDLRRLADDVGIADAVVFAGLRDDVGDLIAAADVCALSSRDECAPQALLEAMALAVPVVATRVGGVPGIVEDSRTGVLVPPADPEALSGALIELLDDPVRRSELAECGRRAVARRFDEATAVRVAEHQLTCLARPPARLTMVLHAVGRGGAEMVLLNLVRALDPAHVTTRLICLQRGGELADAFRDAGCPVEVLGLRMRDPRALATVAHRLRRDADAVLVASHHPEAMTVARVAARLTGTPDIVTVHTMGPNPPAGRCLPRYTVETLGMSRALVVLSASQADYLRHAEGVGTRPWRRAPQHVIPNGVPPASPPRPGEVAAVRAELGLAPDDVVVGTVGRLVPEKDHETLLRAIAHLVPAHPRLRLVVVGGGPREAALRDLAGTLGIAGRVELTGERTDVGRLLTALDVFALSSRQEAAPLAVVEAMHAGLPVVATDCGAVADLVMDGKDGYLVPVGDDGVLAERLGALIGNPAARATLGDHARDHALAEFSDLVMAERFERLIGELSSRPGP